MRRRLSPLLFSLVLAMGLGCSATFDKQGDFKPHRGNRKNLSERLLSPERAQFIHQRSIQLWLPKNPEEGDTTTLVSQAALISADGYALTAAHAVDDGPAFTFHPPDALHRRLRIRQIDARGIENLKFDGTSELLEKARLVPIRTVHRFDGADLALIKVEHQSPTFFSLAPILPSHGEKVYYGFNPIIHKNLRGLTGTITKIKALGSEFWKIECSGAAIFGDSGGPVINGSGELIGNITGASVSFFSPGKEKRVLDVDFQSTSPVSLQALIERDRAIPAKANTQTNEKPPTQLEFTRPSQKQP